MVLKSKGVTLLEMFLVLGLVTGLTVQDIQEKVVETEQASARSLGNELFVYSNAVRKYIAFNYETMSSIIIPSGASKTYTGVDWLKSTSCGGTSPVGMIPCNTPNRTTFGNFPYVVTLENQSGYIYGEADFGPVVTSGEARADLAGLAALTASGLSLNSGSPVAATASAGFSVDPTGNTVPLAEIRLTVDSSPQLDAWLRTDGQNTMNSNITFKQDNTQLYRQIANVSRLFNTNIGTEDAVRFGSAIEYDETSPETLRQLRNVATIINAVVDEDITIDDDLTVTGKGVYQSDSDFQTFVFNSVGKFKIDDDAEVTGSLDAQNDIFNSIGDLRINDNLVVTGNAGVAGSLEVLGDAQVQGVLDANDSIINSTGVVFIDDNLYVAGNTTIDGVINSTNPSVVVQDNLDVQGDVDVKGSNHRVEGDIALKGKMTVDGYLESINNYLVVNDNLDVVGDVEAGVNVTANNDLRSVLDTYVGRNLYVEGDTQMKGDLDIQGRIYNSTGDVLIDDNLIVTGDINAPNFKGDVPVEGGACSSNYVATDANGVQYICKNGVWEKMTSGGGIALSDLNKYESNAGRCGLGGSHATVWCPVGQKLYFGTFRWYQWFGRDGKWPFLQRSYMVERTTATGEIQQGWQVRANDLCYYAVAYCK